MRYMNVILYASVSSLAGGLLGYDMGISGGTISLLSDYFGLDATMKGLVISVFILGAAIGSAFTRVLNDEWGRKMAIFAGAFLFFLGALGVSLFGEDISCFMVMRGLAGIGMGILFSSVPAYITEISPSSLRGRLGSLIQLTTGIGIVIGYGVTYALLEHASHLPALCASWLFIYSTELILAVIYLGLIALIAESPIWLIMQQEDSKAVRVIRKIWPDVDAQDFIVQRRQLDIHATPSEDLVEKMKRSGAYRKLLIIAIAITAFNQLCGINPIIYYAPELLKKIFHNSNLDAEVAIFTGGIFMMGSIASLAIVDRIGRRSLLFIGLLIMTISLLAISTCLYFEIYSLVVVVFIFAFIFAYNFSSGAIRFLYVGELTPTRARASMLGLAGIVNWSVDFIVSWSLPIIAGSAVLNLSFHGSAVYLMYTFFCILFLILILYLPETKGKSLHEISQYWLHHKSQHKTHNYEK